MTQLCYNFFVLRYFSKTATVFDALRCEHSIAVVFSQHYWKIKKVMQWCVCMRPLFERGNVGIRSLNTPSNSKNCDF